MSSSGQQAGPRKCVSCMREIPWDAKVCPYCGHNFEAAQMMKAMEGGKVTPALRALLMILSLLLPFIGIIVGLIFMTREDAEYKMVGKMCLAMAFLGIIIILFCYFIGWLNWAIWYDAIAF